MTACGGFSCCETNGEAGSCCRSETNTFTWNNATILPRADLAGSLATVTATLTATLVSGTAGTTVIAPATTAASSTVSTTSSASLSTATCANHEVAIGAGLGVLLGICLLVLAFLGGMLLRQRKASGSTNNHAMPASSHDTAQSISISAPQYENKSSATYMSELGSNRHSNRYHGASELAN